jgi:hypothetical protein
MSNVVSEALRNAFTSEEQLMIETAVPTVLEARLGSEPSRSLVMIWVCMLALMTLPVSDGAAAAETQDGESSWDFVITPYINIPSMSGTASIYGMTMPVDVSISDIFTENDFAFGLQAEAEAWYQKRWGMIFNGAWIVLKQDNLFLPILPTPSKWLAGSQDERRLLRVLGLVQFLR